MINNLHFKYQKESLTQAQSIYLSRMTFTEMSQIQSFVIKPTPTSDPKLPASHFHLSGESRMTQPLLQPSPFMIATFFLFAVFCGYGAQEPRVFLAQIHQIHPWAVQIANASWWHHFLAVGNLPLDRWRWNTAAPPQHRTGHTVCKDTNICSSTGQDFLTFSIILLSQASPQSGEP